MTEGVLLVFWGKRGYAYSAYNLALSIRSFCDLPIHAMTTEGCLKHLGGMDLPFDSMDVIEEPYDPGRFKVSLYDKMPFDHTLFLDVDALCLKDLRPLMEQFKSEDKPYRCFVYGYYDQTSPNEMPLMIWAYREDIWNHYGLSDHTLPATQSSLQYIRKSDFCEEMFSRLQENFDNPIPLENLRNKWGGTQPDELYLNVTLAQMGYDPQTENAIYFGNDDKYHFHQLQEHFYFLSLFGGRGMIKNKYLRAYDNEVKKLGSKFFHAYIIPDKHANAKTKSLREPKPMNSKDGEINLFTSYFTASPERQKELELCLRKNIENPLIKRIYLVGEEGYDHPKVTHIPHDRPTYADFFREANRIGGDYNILANSDCYFDSSLSRLYGVGFDKTFLAISRHDIKGGRRIIFDATGWGRRGWSQDAWIWKGQIDIKGGDYYLGLPGCDNKIAYEAKESGYRLSNPAREIKVYHVHETNERNYTEQDRLPEPYLNVPIGRIREVNRGRLFLNQPGKHGDILICLPIAEYYSKNYEVEWMCPEAYHHLFAYVDYVKPVTRKNGRYDKEIDLSFGLSRGMVQMWWIKNRSRFDSFVTAKYELAKVPIEERWNLNYKRNETKEDELLGKVVSTEDFILVHRHTDYGTPPTIHPSDNSLEVVEFTKVEGYSIFDWRKVIEKAREIHVIDSSLCNFVEVVDTNAKLFYYPTDRVPNQWDKTLLRKDWVTL